MCFSCFCHSKYHKSITPPLLCFFVFFLMMCTFSNGNLFLVYLLPADIWKESLVLTGDLTQKFCRQTLLLVKFYLIKNMKSNRGNYLTQSKFPFLSILSQWYFFYHMVKFIQFTSFYCLLTICLFAFLTT